jgi:AraC-like DNA-binding protein
LLRALATILERPADAHDLGSLAREAGMSRSAFAARFAVTFARSPMAFLRDVRLRRGAQMLETTDAPVAVVARTVGFASRTYFSRAFRSAYGVDPHSFRQGLPKE